MEYKLLFFFLMLMCFVYMCLIGYLFYTYPWTIIPIVGLTVGVIWYGTRNAQKLPPEADF